MAKSKIPTAKISAENSKTTSKTTSKKVISLQRESTDSVSNVRAEAPRPLSPKEKIVLEFLEGYIRSKGLSPTYQEICQHFGFASFNSVQRYLKQLEVKGYIQLPWANQKRAITLLQPSSALQDAIEGLSDSGRDSGRVSGPVSGPDTGNRPSNGSNVTPALVPSENFTLPLLGRVAAGAPIEAFEHDEFIDVPASLVRQPDRTYALRVQGQSMIEDGILDGDVILVQRQTTASNGEIIVAVVGNDEATVKRFYMHRGDSPQARKAIESRFEGDEEFSFRGDKMIELRPANSSMTPMWYDPSEVQIRGVVVGLIRRFF